MRRQRVRKQVHGFIESLGIRGADPAGPTCPPPSWHGLENLEPRLLLSVTIDPPANLDAEITADGVALWWDSVTGAESYRVY